jgi:CheY-like chemotaxis protein
MRLLVAQDNYDTAKVYKLALKHRGHRVTLTATGEDCLKSYNDRLQDIMLHTDPKEHVQPFDAVILDYKMPKMNGLKVAKEILAVNPYQRIIFTSTYVKGKLKDSVPQLKQRIEILNKPFSEQDLVDKVEDEHIYSALKELNVNIDDIKKARLRHEQLRDILCILKKARKQNQKEVSNH